MDTGLSPYTGLANRRLQPLGHLSLSYLQYRRAMPWSIGCAVPWDDADGNSHGAAAGAGNVKTRVWPSFLARLGGQTRMAIAPNAVFANKRPHAKKPAFRPQKSHLPKRTATPKNAVFRGLLRRGLAYCCIMREHFPDLAGNTLMKTFLASLNGRTIRLACTLLAVLTVCTIAAAAGPSESAVRVARCWTASRLWPARRLRWLSW